MRLSIRYRAFVLALCFEGVAADFQFKSRPDLSPPRLNITTKGESSLLPGYIFIAPYNGFDDGNSGPQQPGAYIFQDDGELIWSGLGYIGGWPANFGPITWKGQPALRAFQGRLEPGQGRGFGNHVILNERYEIVKTVRAGSHRLESVHEFDVIEGGTEGHVLIEVPVVKPVGLQRWGGKKDQIWIIDNGFQELDIETGEVIFEWYSLNRVDPKNSALSLESGYGGSGRSSNDPWNYFHINSIDKNDDGDYLISARNYASIFKINGSTGDIIWTLGGLPSQPSDFKFHNTARFAFQHDARFRMSSKDGKGAITTETISLFDNGAHSSELKVHNTSRARLLLLDHSHRTASAEATFIAPGGLLARSQGNAQVLADNSVFVNWGQAGGISIFNKHGDIAFHAALDSTPSSGVQSYRGFKGNWTGKPYEEPAIVVLEEDGKVEAYVSWNGDTEAVAWRFYVNPTEHAFKGSNYAGQSERRGFETRFDLSRVLLRTPGQVFALAVDDRGRTLARTKTVSVSQWVFEAEKGTYSSINQCCNYKKQNPLM